MKRWMKMGIIAIITFTMLVLGVYLYVEYNSKAVFEESYDAENWKNPLKNMGIKDADYIYEEDEQVEAEKLYVTIVNKSDKGKKEIFFESGEKNLLEHAIITREPNASIEIRGKESEEAPQSSFKIRLFDREGLWHNQNIINLNKYYFDSLRIRNKLSFDYFKMIPNITSFRTRFVTLYVKDLTKKKQEMKFEDYGLFTQIEQPNKLFLKNHELDLNGQLYEAESFNFSRYPDVIMDKKDNRYAKKKFEKVLEINGNEDHKKLINMLEAVNDYSKDINGVVDEYFDKENYLTWIAVNILFDNYKTSSKNFFLYSPLNGQKWYFMPWDYDQAWNFEENRPKWQKGLSVYWDNVLHRRFFEEKENVEALNKKIEELSGIINKEQTQKFLDSYYDILLSNITKLSDLKYLPVTLDEYKREYEDISNMTERNKFQYYELLENPMPFCLLEPKRNKNRYIFKWNKAYDIQGDQLYYDFELSYDRNFSNIIKQIKDIKDLKVVVEVEDIKNTICYWRVIARDKKGNTQIAYDIERDEYGQKYYGIKQLDTDNISEVSESELELEGTKDTEETKNEVSQTIPKEEINKNENVVENNIKPKIIYMRYKVRPGDTLFLISRKFYGYNGMVEAIRRLNNIKDVSNLRVGTRLKLPNTSRGPIKQKIEVPLTYKLKPGETLFSVSMKFYGTQEKIEEIKKLNNIDDINNIFVGTLLKLP
ncbi:CotH kinase family protein [Marinisporobacter balticus]|uniref:Spore coat protein H n=1 Tax=Marinisporobacter balticus TaxID=2018667 RepID=A0A4R2K8X9_9FIRM|nr:CotH kinase family protein [Marinisporobacter balticus]TCO69831.1 spore coat protein H [Marinisporobacter balticus]